MLYPCPACGFEVFGEPPGSFEICPVCNWEDDPVQLQFPRSAIGANHLCLSDWQRQALQQLPLHIREDSGWRRSVDWKPLSPEAVSKDEGTPKTGWEYFLAFPGTDTETDS